MADTKDTGLSELERFRIRMIGEEHNRQMRKLHGIRALARDGVWVSAHWRKKSPSR